MVLKQLLSQKVQQEKQYRLLIILDISFTIHFNYKAQWAARMFQLIVFEPISVVWVWTYRFPYPLLL